ncbi:MAG: hypothetical protein JWR85_3608 [Marmoricola sp.]|nr:hypothetical protein [Marmoricola sp.]
MSVYLDLAARCEAATGGDRELDALIRCAVFADEDSYVEQSKINGAWCIYRTNYSGNARSWEPHGLSHEQRNGSFTADLNAAMTLVPEAHTVQLSDWDHEILRAKGPWQAIVLPLGARGSMKDFTFTNRCDHAASAALALTIASLRARDAASTGEAL